MSLSALRKAAGEHHAAAQEALLADEWIQKRTSVESNENFIKKNVDQYEMHQKIAELFLESVRYANKMTESEPVNSELAKIQSELAGAFHELASYRQECLLAEKIQAERVADFNEHQIDVEEAPTLTDPREEELREQINKLQQQEKL
ncbi:MAG: hypothetical protein NT164_05580 [Verrucomicrobiae bacterium]|nr:hypothetical protein [Verrucomicrobiae bacterium]